MKNPHSPNYCINIKRLFKPSYDNCQFSIFIIPNLYGNNIVNDVQQEYPNQKKQCINYLNEFYIDNT